jgi:starch synthase
MKVLVVSAEVAPFAKVGGLADVAGSLPKALKSLGIDVRVVMPDYAMIENAGYPIETVVEHFDTHINHFWTKPTRVRQTPLGDVPVYLVGTDEWFQEADRSERVYLPGVDKYLFFSQAVLQMLEPLGWIPDVIHANDWHTGFIPVLAREIPDFAEIATVFTIHNLAYQGEFDIDVLDRLGLPRNLFNPSGVEAWGRVNFLKSGAAFADQVNTVSESYAEEIETPEFGCTLEGLMRFLADRGRLSGILNGLDTDVFNPATDPDIPFHFDLDHPGPKAECKEALLEELKMEQVDGAPLLGIVSRLSSQKGIDLVVQALGTMARLPVQIVVLGAGDPSIARDLTELQRRYPQHLRFIEGFHLTLATRIYAGCDGFLMPSKFEPCGLGQMIAMRYGTVPVVRKVGGLGDTVFEGWNGFVFEHAEAGALIAAVRRLHEAYASPDVWSRLMRCGMAGEYGWHTSARKYEALYKRAIGMRQASGLQSA